MNKIRLAFLSVLIGIAGMFAIASVPQQAHAALFSRATDQACSGAALQDDGTCAGQIGAENKVNKLLTTVLEILSYVIGIIAVIMMIVGGIRFITSQGEGSSINAARNTVIYAAVGLIIAALAQVLVKFVVGKLS